MVALNVFFWRGLWEEESDYLKLTMIELLYSWRKHFTAIFAVVLQIVMGSTVLVAPSTPKRILTEVQKSGHVLVKFCV